LDRIGSRRTGAKADDLAVFDKLKAGARGGFFFDFVGHSWVQVLRMRSDFIANQVWRGVKMGRFIFPLVQCLCESSETLAYRNLVESAKAEKQRFRVGTLQRATIDRENFNTLGRRQLFGAS
jgi:hypothetical protein